MEYITHKYENKEIHACATDYIFYTENCNSVLQ